jgi:hypothetical protein
MYVPNEERLNTNQHHRRRRIEHPSFAATCTIQEDEWTKILKSKFLNTNNLFVRFFVEYFRFDGSPQHKTDLLQILMFGFQFERS